jgi:regulator of sigma E protease
MRVEDFSLFFGPRLVRIGKFGGTEYNIRSVPLGGFVKIAGMEPDDLVLGAAILPPHGSNGKAAVMYGLSEDDMASLNQERIGERVRAAADGAVDSGDRKRLSPEGKLELKSLLLSTGINEEEQKYIEVLLKADAYVPDPQGYNQRPIWQRAAVITAGPVASLLFGLLVFVLMGFTTGLPNEGRSENVIEALRDAKAPAARAGLLPGDRIVEINGTPIRDGAGMVGIIHKSAGKPLALRVQRGDRIFVTSVTPELGEVPDVVDGKLTKRMMGLIGVTPRLGVKRYSPIASIRIGVDMFSRTITGMLGAIFSRDIAKNTGGIIKIGAIIHQESKAGLRYLLLTAASLSLSLGICNLFPIPVLDGGHLLLLAWEGIRRRKLTSREVLAAQLCGLSIIAVLFVLVTYKDFITEVLPHLIKHA